MSGNVLHVAVGVIVNTEHEVLISKRSSDVHQANRWEFPGGKIKQNESHEEALSRELKEELGIDVHSPDLLISINYDYGDKLVCLHTYIINHFSGKPAGLEGQPVQWVKLDELQNYRFPDANMAIINALQLPDLIQITGGFSSLEDLILKSKKCIGNGVRIIQFRAHDLDESTYIQYAKPLLELCKLHNVKLVLNRTLEVLQQVGADGLHLNRYEMMKYSKRPCSMNKLLSVSCHNQCELDHAEQLLADYCFLSPIKPARSHNAGSALGLEKFSVLAAKCLVPVYALGGMSKHDVNEIVSHKGRGVAMISGDWR